MNCQEIYLTDCSVFALSMLKTGSYFCVFIRGIHPVCGEPLFCFSANPDSLSELCGFHIDHRSRSFLLQVSGVSSRLSFCCTSLVSGFIIHGSGRFVYSQTVQQLPLVFALKVQKAGIHETRPKLSGRLWTICRKKREISAGPLCEVKICAIITGNEW